MDPATLKLAANIALSLAKSRAGRRLVGAVLVIWSLLLSAVLFLPAYIVSAGSSAMFRVHAAQSCLPTGQLAGVPAALSNPGALDNLRVATWNTLKSNSVSKVTAGVRSIGADVIGLQEMQGGSRPGLRRALAGQYEMSTANNAVPVLWRSSRLQLVAQGSKRVFGVRHVEGGVSGTSVGPKSVTWVTLKQRDTGAVFSLVNHHLLPTIDRGGHPDRGRPARVALARQQIAAAIRVAGQLRAAGAPVLVAADWNVDLRRDAPSHRWLTAAMNEEGLYSNWAVLEKSGNTHDNRLIDAIWSHTASATFASQQILGRFGSDHAAVLVRVTSRPAVTGSPVTTSLTTSTLPSQLDVPGPQPGTTIKLDAEQIKNSAVVISEGKAHRIPEYGWIIALATALQESGIKSLSYGDRDSSGIFQGRPSQGWGTAAQNQDPRLASQAFYGVAGHTANPGLTDISGWRAMSVTEAAQAVQRSAFGNAYAKWEAAARAIVQRLSGSTGATATSPLLCGTGQDPALGNCSPTGSPAERGLSRDALLVLRCGHSQFPSIRTFYGIGSRNGVSDHPSGRAVDLMISDVFPSYKSAEGSAFGWQIANWLRSHAAELGVTYVIFAAKIWSTQRHGEGWRAYVGENGGDTAMHYDHVHVSVAGDQGTGFRPASDVGDTTVPAGSWTMPLPPGRYRVGCGMGCYAGHTGQDFPTRSGTKVYASSDGVVTRSVAIKRDGKYVSYGNLVVFRVKGSPGMEVYNAHLQQRLVSVGDVVRAGQVIGLSGYTGRVIPQGEGGAHLHYEIRMEGKPVNPMPILLARGVRS